VYRELQRSFLAVPGAFQRAGFWELYTQQARAKL
jgi:hypothetical protein